MQKKAKFEHIVHQEDESFRTFEVKGPRFDHPFHYHPEIELTLIMESTGMRMVGDNLSPFSRNDLCLFGPNLPHIYHNSGEKDPVREARAIVIQFKRDCGGGMFDALPEFEDIAYMLDQSKSGLCFPRHTVDRVSPKILGLFYLKGSKRILLFIEILIILAEALGDPIASSGYSHELDEHRSERINKACRYIFQNSHHEITLCDVAKEIGMTCSAFGRFFHRETNQTYKQFLNDIRFGHASNILVETDHPIIEVCHAAGFGNLSNFNRRFKERYQLSPTGFRKLAKKMLQERRRGL